MTSEKFIQMQQDIIDREMLAMEPKDVGEILMDMSKDEANTFLGGLGRVRAQAIADQYDEGEGCLDAILGGSWCLLCLVAILLLGR